MLSKLLKAFKAFKQALKALKALRGLKGLKDFDLLEKKSDCEWSEMRKCATRTPLKS